MVTPPYGWPDRSWLRTEPLPLGDDFLWGVANAAYQVEGGINGPGAAAPRNDWAGWEAVGRAAPTGRAAAFWTDPERHLDLAAALGLNAFRLSVEWARLEPTRAGGVDRAAVTHYARILCACRDRGLEPVVTLQHFTHPAWLGRTPWLGAAGPEAFERFVAAAVPAIVGAMADRGAEPPRWWITVNEPNILAFSAYAIGAFPPGGRPSVARFRRALDGLMTAHVLAYRAVHAAYAARRLPSPIVAFNDYSMSAYLLDRALVDMAFARQDGLPATGLRPRLRDERDRWNGALAGFRGPFARRADRLLERVLLPDPVGALPSFVRTLYGGERALDAVVVDFYVLAMSDYLRSPFVRAWRERMAPVVADLWETTIRPEGLRALLHASSPPGRSEPVLVAENGMGTFGAEVPGYRPSRRPRAGREEPNMSPARPDGWTRPAFLRAHIGELLRAAREGARVRGYLHWTLVDNYEWGSYRPRFGLYGIDRSSGEPRILGTDAQGEDPAVAYGTIVRAARARDGEALARALAG